MNPSGSGIIATPMDEAEEIFVVVEDTTEEEETKEEEDTKADPLVGGTEEEGVGAADVEAENGGICPDRLSFVS